LNSYPTKLEWRKFVSEAYVVYGCDLAGDGFDRR